MFDNLEPLIELIAREYGVTTAMLKAKDRSAFISCRRHIATYILANATDASLAQIAHALGRKDHTSAINGVRRVEVMLARNASLRVKIADQILRIKSLVKLLREVAA